MFLVIKSYGDNRFLKFFYWIRELDIYIKYMIRISLIF